MIAQHAFLYVEDDALSRDGLDVVLRRVMGIDQLWMFEDSADFISRVHGLPCKPDVFLLDIHMQPYTGFEMLSMLRSDPAYARSTVIALTASVMNEEVEMLRTSGFNGVIGKPIDVSTFPDLIERVVGGESIWHITH
jgi:CheY-like chemotaxis protein